MTFPHDTDGLVLDDIVHGFNGTAVVDGFSLDVAPGELVCLLGPSGCGKSTGLRVAAGLETPWRGRVFIDGDPVFDDTVNQPPENRNVGFLFQDFALFPHLDVAGNVGFGLNKWNAVARRNRVNEVLEQVGLADRAGDHPHTLSGGQQQRIALARALAPDPVLVLLDEPFSGLDTTLRAQVRDQTLHVLKERRVATLMVTHDPEEAMFMADRIALMRDGKLVQVGTPEDLYRRPVDGFTAGFFGEINALQGVVRHDGRVETPLGRVDAPGGLHEGDPVDILIRPEALRLIRLGGGNAPDGAATVEASRLLGRTSLIHLRVENGGTGLHLHARMPGAYLPGEGEKVVIDLDRAQSFVFPRS